MVGDAAERRRRKRRPGGGDDSWARGILLGPGDRPPRTAPDPGPEARDGAAGRRAGPAAPRVSTPRPAPEPPPPPPPRSPPTRCRGGGGASDRSGGDGAPVAGGARGRATAASGRKPPRGERRAGGGGFDDGWARGMFSSPGRGEERKKEPRKIPIAAGVDPDWLVADGGDDSPTAQPSDGAARPVASAHKPRARAAGSLLDDDIGPPWAHRGGGTDPGRPRPSLLVVDRDGGRGGDPPGRAGGVGDGRGRDALPPVLLHPRSSGGIEGEGDGGEGGESGFTLRAVSTRRGGAAKRDTAGGRHVVGTTPGAWLLGFEGTRVVDPLVMGGAPDAAGGAKKTMGRPLIAELDGGAGETAPGTAREGGARAEASGSKVHNLSSAAPGDAEEAQTDLRGTAEGAGRPRIPNNTAAGDGRAGPPPRGGAASPASQRSGLSPSAFPTGDSSGEARAADHARVPPSAAAALASDLSLLMLRLERGGRGRRRGHESDRAGMKDDARIKGFLDRYLPSEWGVRAGPPDGRCETGPSSTGAAAVAVASIIFESILPSVAPHARTSFDPGGPRGPLPPSARVGLALLERAPTAAVGGVLPFLRPDEEEGPDERSGRAAGGNGGDDDGGAGKTGRVRALGAAVLLRIHARWGLRRLDREAAAAATPTVGDADGRSLVDDGSGDDCGATAEADRVSALASLVREALPLLADLVSSPGGGGGSGGVECAAVVPGRTVLATASADAILLIAELAAAESLGSASSGGDSRRDSGVPGPPAGGGLAGALRGGALRALGGAVRARRAWAEGAAAAAASGGGGERGACEASVASDWLAVLGEEREERRDPRSPVDGRRGREGGRVAAEDELLRELAGARLPIRAGPDGGGAGDRRVGGIAWTMCSRRGGAVGADDAVGILAEAVRLATAAASSSRGRERPGDSGYPPAGGDRKEEDGAGRRSAGVGEGDAAPLVRAYAAWLCGDKRRVRTLEETRAGCTEESDGGTALTRSAELCVELLRSGSGRCADLALATLNLLWSNSGGLPPDVLNTADGDTPAGPSALPATFESLLGILRLCPWRESEEDEEPNRPLSLPPTIRAVCALVALCVATDPALLPAMLDRNGAASDTTVEVLTMLLGEATATGGSVRERAAEVLMNNVGRSPHLRRKMASDPGLFLSLSPRRTVPALVSIVAGAEGAPGEARDGDDGPSLADYAVSAEEAALAALDNIAAARAGVAGGASELVGSALEALRRIEGEGDGGGDSDGGRGADTSDRPDPARCMERTCSSVGASWRLRLLSVPGDRPGGGRGRGGGYEHVLVSAARHMFRDPTSRVPLCLFGALVGDGTDVVAAAVAPGGDSGGCGGDDGDAIRWLREERVRSATSALVELGAEEMGRTLGGGGGGREPAVVDEGCSASDGGKGVVFARLSPLLVLRRVPASYFRILHREAGGACEEPHSGRLRSLADAIALRLDVAPPSGEADASSPIVSVTAEERRLAAELAGRCLPFFSAASHRDREGGLGEGSHTERIRASSPLSCVGRICIPAFSEAVRCLAFPRQAGGGAGEQIGREARMGALRRARAALYASCHHVPVGGDDDDGTGLFVVASFALLILLQPPPVATDGDDEDFVLLQTGSIEFFSICMESLATRRAPGTPPQYPGSDGEKRRLIVEVPHGAAGGSPVHESSPPEAPPASFFASLSFVASLLVRAVTEARLRREWMMRFAGTFGDPQLAHGLLGGEGPEAEVSPSARTCLLNSIVLAARRCPDEDGALQRFGTHFLRPVVQWGTRGEAVGGTHTDPHPLCTAAAMQLVFTFIARTKSLRCLVNDEWGNRVGCSSLEQCVSSIHSWALDAVREASCNNGSSGVYSFIEVRKAGLKLLLTMATVGQISGGLRLEECLSPSELAKMLSVLNSVVNVDADPEARALAEKILFGLQQHV